MRNKDNLYLSKIVKIGTKIKKIDGLKIIIRF